MNYLPMSAIESRGSRTARAAPPKINPKINRVSTESKLALTESLLMSVEVSECARLCMEWLGKHIGVDKALCLIADSSQNRLIPLAHWGMSPVEIQEPSPELDDQRHPLVAAMAKKHPVTFYGNFTNPHNHAGRTGESRFEAISLRGAGEDDNVAGVGVLLVSPIISRTNADLRWLADILGRVMWLRFRTHSLAEVERVLRRERGLLYNIVNTVHDPIILTDTEGRLIISNKAAELLFGSREEESEGRRRAVALNNTFLSAALSRRALEEPASLSRELLLVDPVEGSDLFFELSSTEFSDVHEGTGVVAILRNVSDLHRTTQELEENYRKLRTAEAEVRSERDRLDLIISSVAEPILVTDPEGKILMMNDPAERLFTVPPSSTPEAAQTVRANDANFSSFVSNLFFLSEGRQHHGGISLVDPEKGTPVPVEAFSAKIISQQGELIGIATILHDQSEAIEKARLYEQLQRVSEALEEKVREATAELVRQNEVLRRQHMELQRASALKSQFLASVSHELRTPLNSIIGYTRILLQGVSGSLNPQQLGNLARLDANAGHLLSLINQLLDITRIEAGKMPVNLVRISISKLIAEVMSEVEPLILQAKLEVTTEVTSDLPEVVSDPEKIKQIMLNLLMNALKYTPAGWVRVSAAYVPRPDQIAITVADSGIGIAESDQEKIFEDFGRADNSVAKGYAGVGLGLAICRRLSALLGGKMTVTSKPRQGSSFTLALPRSGRGQ